MAAFRFTAAGALTVRAALCLPSDSQSAPAVVVLHGCGGFGTLDQVLARDLPTYGIGTFYVDERHAVAFLRRSLG